MVTWIAVSPAYARTGTVVAIAQQFNCSKNCQGLWVSHNGGSSWRRAAAKNWQPSRLVIAVDSSQHEVFFGASSATLSRSDDGGETWRAAGTGGMPTVLPSYATQHQVVVAAAGGPNDYRLTGTSPTPVNGSGGADVDLQFMVPNGYPSAGTYSAALLAALDPNSHLPVVYRCTADFACSHPTSLSLNVTPWSGTSAGTLLYAANDYAQLGSVFADTPVGVQKSMDGGATFKPLTVVSTPGAAVTATPMMALAPDYREAGPVRTAYVAVFQAIDPQSRTDAHTAGGIYRTTDGGASWAALATTGPFKGGAQAVAEAPDGRLFAGYYDGAGHGGLLCSVDSGSSWAPSCPVAGQQGSGPSSVNGSTVCGSSCSQSGDRGTPAGASAAAHPGGGSDGETVGVKLQGSPNAASILRRPGAWPYMLAAILAAVIAAAVIARVRFRRRQGEPLPDPAPGSD
jgi:hypothetical protein